MNGAVLIVPYHKSHQNGTDPTISLQDEGKWSYIEFDCFYILFSKTKPAFEHG